MATVTQGDFLNACDKLLTAATANAGPPAVEELRQQLEKDTNGAKEAQSRRNLHRFQAQQASRDLDRFMTAARTIYSRLRHILVGVFGQDAEKLVEFGLQPFRGPQVTLAQKVERFLEKEQEKEKPPVKGQSPTQAANSQTESTN